MVVTTKIVSSMNGCTMRAEEASHRRQVGRRRRFRVVGLSTYGRPGGRIDVASGGGGEQGGIRMVRVLSVVAAVAAMLLVVGGVAQASPDRYEVVGKWTLTNPDGGGHIEPDMQDDYVEVNCREGDLLRSYEINDRSILSDEHIRYDRAAGVFAYPDFSKVGSADTKVLEIRITCRSA
jgi:hypothetical protein